MRRNYRTLAVLLGVLGLAALVVPTGAGALKVTNPGQFRLKSNGGQIIIGSAMNIRLASNPLPECSDGIDNDFDGLIDLADFQCAPGPNGEPASADNSELAPGFQPKVDVSIVGNIDAAGNMTIPPSGVVFPPSWVKLTHPVDGSPAIVRVDTLPTAAATGTLNPNTGEMVLNVKLRAKLSGDLWGNYLPEGCAIGTTGAPIAVRFTSGSLPAIGNSPRISGSAYNPDSGRAMLVSNDFFVPGASGCIINGWLDINQTINDAIHLPSQVGNNKASLSGEIDPIIGAGIRPRISSNPAVLTGTAPFAVDFNSGASSVVKTPATYKWDFADGTSSTEAHPSHTFNTPGEHIVSLTITDADGDTSTATAKVTVLPGTSTTTSTTSTTVPPTSSTTTTSSTTVPPTSSTTTTSTTSTTSTTVPPTSSTTTTSTTSTTSTTVPPTSSTTTTSTTSTTVPPTSSTTTTSTTSTTVPPTSSTTTTTTPPATNDSVSVKLSGSVNYQNGGNGTGNIVVGRDGFGLVSANGYLDIPSKVSGKARVTVNVNRLWILPLWSGNVAVSDPAAGVNQSTPLLGGVTSTASPASAGSTTNWFKLGSFPDLIQPYSLTWSAIDAN